MTFARAFRAGQSAPAVWSGICVLLWGSATRTDRQTTRQRQRRQIRQRHWALWHCQCLAAVRTHTHPTYHWNVAVAEQQVRRYPVHVAALVQRLKLHIPIVVWGMRVINTPICGWEISPDCYYYMFQVKYNRVRRSDVVTLMLIKFLLIFKKFRVSNFKIQEVSSEPLHFQTLTLVYI